MWQKWHCYRLFIVGEDVDSFGTRMPQRLGPAAAPCHLPGRLRTLLQFVLVAALLWGIDAAAMLRPGAEPAGLAHARVIESVSRWIGGAVMLPMNHWLAAHPLPAAAAAAWYIVPNVAVTGAAGLVLLLARPPRYALHRNALVAMGLVALTAWWLYPVAPPRMLPGYHDVTATVVPVFARLFEGHTADQFAALPSIHVAWALWVAIVSQALLRRRLWRLAVWVYPALTMLDVLATANHYLLDVVAAPAAVALGYLLAGLARQVRGAARARVPRHLRTGGPVPADVPPPASIRPGTSAPPGPLPSKTPAGMIRE